MTATLREKLCDIAASEPHPTAIGILKPGNDLQDRALARTTRPHNRRTGTLNGAAFLAFSSIAERTDRTISAADNRSLFFLGRIAEGGETVFVHSLWLLLER
ncbi:putative transmembrane protein [Leifsonia rubra CMS 76R]|nr:putative transmembrane protein [Leifsonia rubra CMS 76R]